MRISIKPRLVATVVLLAIVTLGGKLGVVHAQQVGAYMYQASSGSTASVKLVTSSGQTQTITIPNQTPPSILQEIDFPATPAAINSGCFGVQCYFADDAMIGNFVTSGSGNLPFVWSPESADAIWGPTIYPADYMDWISMNYYIWLSEMSYYGLSEIYDSSSMVNTISTEDAVIDTIAKTGKFTIQIGTISPLTSQIFPQNMSAPATNCVALSGSGSTKIVFERSVDWYSSVSDFLVQALAFRNQLLVQSPYSNNPNGYSFYADLKKQATNPYDLTSGAAVSSCGGGASEYRYIVPAPIVTGVMKDASGVLEPGIDNNTVNEIYGSGFSPYGQNTIQLLSATTSQPLYYLEIPTGTGNSPFNDTSHLYTNFVQKDVMAVVPDGSYLLRVAALNSVWSNTVPVIVASTPKPPKNLVVMANKKGEAELSWTEGSPRGNIYEYIVEKSPQNGVFTQVDSVSVTSDITIPNDQINDEDTELSPAKTFTYRVKAKYRTDLNGNPVSDSDYTNTASITTLPKTESPILTASVGPNSSLVLSWLDLDSGDVVGYSIQDHNNNVEIDAGLDNTHTVSGLTSGTQYCYSIISIVNKNNESDPSDIACATADANAQDVPIDSTDPISSISGSDNVSVPITDSNVSSVDLVVNGKTIGTDTSAPYNFSFDSTQFPSGPGQMFTVVHYPSQPPVSSTPKPITINNTPTITSATVNPSSPNFKVVGSGYSSTGNSVGLSTSSVSTPTYIVANLSSNGNTMPFQAPSTVYDGVYKVSVKSSVSNWVNTASTVTVSGNGSVPTTPSTTTPPVIPPTPSGSLPTSVAGVARSSITATASVKSSYYKPVGGCNAGDVETTDPNSYNTIWCQHTVTTYTCPATYVVSGSTCNPSPAYTCPTGYTASGSTCNPNLTPIKFKVTAGSGLNSGTTNISWVSPTYAPVDANTYSTKIYIERATVLSGPWTEVAVNPTIYAKDHTDTAIIPATTVYYRMRAWFANGGYGPYTNVLSITTPNAPATPILSVSIVSSSSASIDLTWTGGTDQFYIYKSPSSDPIGKSTAKTYRVDGLAYNTNYCFAVAAYNNDLYKSPGSNIVCITTPQLPAPVLSSVSNGTASKNAFGKIVVTPVQGSIYFSGSAPSDISSTIQITSMSVERSLSATSGFVEIAVDNNSDISTASWKYVDSTVSAATVYYYRARYMYSDGTYGAYSNIMSVTSAKPTIPSLKVSSKHETSLDLSWKKDTDRGLSSFDLTYSPDIAPIATLQPTDLDYTVSNLVPNTQYCFVLKATFTTYAYASSPVVCATTSKSVALSGLSAKASGQTISLVWKSGTMVSIERSISKTEGFIKLTTSTSTTYTDDSGLAPATTYYYRLRKVYSDNSYGIYSSVVSAKTATVAVTPNVMSKDAAVQSKTDTTTAGKTSDATTPTNTTTVTPTNTTQPTTTTTVTPSSTSVTPTTSTSCPSGYVKYNSVCKNLTSTIPLVIKYTCPTGYALNQTTKMCDLPTVATTTDTIVPPTTATINTDQIVPAQTNAASTQAPIPATVTYNCSSGYVLNGSQCTLTTTIPATAKTSCPTGYVKLNNTCKNLKGTIDLITTYTCTSGYTLNSDGTTCTSSSVTVPATATYSCSTGSILDNATKTCNQSTSAAFATSTTTASVFDSLVGWFAGWFR